MALPHTNITPIPDNEPDAVPSLWNTRYVEIDQNFQNHEGRLAATEGEVLAARGDKANVGERLNQMESDIEGLDPDMQNMVVSSIMGVIGNQGVLAKELARVESERKVETNRIEADYGNDYQAALGYLATKLLDDIALAHKEHKKTLGMRFQEGLITLRNRGVISGCTVSKSATAARNVTLAAGRIFIKGRVYDVRELVNCASIPNNNSGAAKTCYVFVWIDQNGIIQCDATDLDQAVPDYGVALYEVTVPANNNDINDPYLGSVTLTDRRRLEPNWPIVLSAPCYALVQLGAPIPGVDYVVHLDLMEFSGPAPSMDGFLVQDRLENGFKVYFSGMSDDLLLRYLVSRAGV